MDQEQDIKFRTDEVLRRLVVEELAARIGMTGLQEILDAHGTLLPEQGTPDQLMEVFQLFRDIIPQEVQHRLEKVSFSEFLLQLAASAMTPRDVDEAHWRTCVTHRKVLTFFFEEILYAFEGRYTIGGFQLRFNVMVASLSKEEQAELVVSDGAKEHLVHWGELMTDPENVLCLAKRLSEFGDPTMQRDYLLTVIFAVIDDPALLSGEVFREALRATTKA